jgi:hypothetical protein
MTGRMGSLLRALKEDKMFPLATKNTVMKIKSVLAIITISLIVVSASPSQAVETTVEQMPADLETQFALSALHAAMRNQATVYLLDPKKGYQLFRQGTSGVTCLVERTAWEQVDFRNDIYVPLCYDAEGSKSFLKVIMDAATLRIQGINPVALKAEIENRYKNKTYKVPEKPGLSYMIAPVQRTWMLPDSEHDERGHWSSSNFQSSLSVHF